MASGRFDDIERRFTYHPLGEDKPLRLEKIMSQARAMAVLVEMECPDGREKALALTHLEEVVFWARAAIERYRHVGGQPSCDNSPRKS